MQEFPPTCRPDGVYSAKRACVELGISYKTLRKYRTMGLIEPLNPTNKARSRYTGASIIECWYKAIKV